MNAWKMKILKKYAATGKNILIISRKTGKSALAIKTSALGTGNSPSKETQKPVLH